MYKILLSAAAVMVLMACSGSKTSTVATNDFTDARDGEAYKYVRIGNQEWMSQNLNYATSESWCYDDVRINCKNYGRLYSMKAAMEACPEGWHLPSDAEWSQLIAHLGGEENAGGKMKATSGWDNGGNGTNSSGFNGLPGGQRLGDGFFDPLGSFGFWWTATPKDEANGWLRSLSHFGNSAKKLDFNKENGFSVRCVKD